MQNLWRLIFLVLLWCASPGWGEATLRIATWNLQWFPGHTPTSSESDRLLHMSAAKDALLELKPDILCLQEVRDWDCVNELVTVLPKFQPLVVSRFREMGTSGALTIQQTAIAANKHADSA